MVKKLRWSDLDIVWKGNPERAHSKKDQKLLNGHYEYYYDNGALRTKGTWINGMKEGAWQYFNKNGTIWGRGFYHNDIRFPGRKSWEMRDENGVPLANDSKI